MFCTEFNCCLVLKVQYMHPYLILNGGFYNCFMLPCFPPACETAWPQNGGLLEAVQFGLIFVPTSLSRMLML